MINEQLIDNERVKPGPSPYECILEREIVMKALFFMAQGCNTNKKLKKRGIGPSWNQYRREIKKDNSKSIKVGYPEILEELGLITITRRDRGLQVFSINRESFLKYVFTKIVEEINDKIKEKLDLKEFFQNGNQIGVYETIAENILIRCYTLIFIYKNYDFYKALRIVRKKESIIYNSKSDYDKGTGFNIYTNNAEFVEKNPEDLWTKFKHACTDYILAMDEDYKVLRESYKYNNILIKERAVI